MVDLVDSIGLKLERNGNSPQFSGALSSDCWRPAPYIAGAPQITGALRLLEPCPQIAGGLEPLRLPSALQIAGPLRLIGPLSFLGARQQIVGAHQIAGGPSDCWGPLCIAQPAQPIATPLIGNAQSRKSKKGSFFALVLTKRGVSLKLKGKIWNCVCVQSVGICKRDGLRYMKAEDLREGWEDDGMKDVWSVFKC